MIEKIHIYHTNDLHSHFEPWPKIVQYIEDMRKLHSEKNEEMFLFDIGDHMDRFHPITESTFGKLNVRLLNQLNYNAVTIGNNEGITLPYEALNELYRDATFDVVLANLFTPDGTRPSWAKAYQIYTTKENTRIGIIGLTVFYQLFYELLGWKIHDPFELLRTLLVELNDQTDVIIVLSHLGITEDEELAKIPGIDIILGGHTHHLFEEGKIVDDVLLCGAGKYGQYIGYVELKVNQASKAIVEKRATVIATSQLNSESISTKETLNDAMKESELILNEKIGHIPDELINNWFEISPFSQLLADILKEWCAGEISMVNAGVLLDSLPKGPISKGEIHRVCPHPINPCNVWLKGYELKEIILQANTERMENLRFKGLGFRGEVMGKMVFSGVGIDVKVLSDGLKHIQNITINGDPIELKRTYKVSTIDMFTLGYLFPIIRDTKRKEYFMPEMLRDLLISKLAENHRL
ncbi:bifunctional metallophosphatase/5'-nucleotidase [Litchfieldia alkalitelluris]|uniref:bifunctional metallophosphatase/5'-nucleotidase n=1 Tax=Litchfieldia alkalitelluris TaxID=304268 RepID=UPI000997BAA6|nr:bifunctional UDP-sugar hydrolase/5'-nucleotidase [Litchfieldia alkalitelluris]